MHVLNLRDLDNSQIHIWYLHPSEYNQEVSINQYCHMLTCDENKRRTRFYFEKDRHRYLLTRYLVRSVISVYFPHISPSSWLFTANKFGRPEVGEPSIPPKFSFNLSHSENLIVCAVSTTGTVGIDIEYVRKDRQLLRISDRFFSCQESAFLNTLNETNKIKYFHKLWTLKEAFSKAEGKGLYIDFDKFWFKLQSNIIHFDFDTSLDIKPQKYCFFQVRLKDGIFNRTCELGVAINVKQKIKEAVVTKLFKFNPLGTHKGEILHFSYQSKL